MPPLSQALWSIGLSAAEELKREAINLAELERERNKAAESERFTEGRVWPVKPNVKND